MCINKLIERYASNSEVRSRRDIEQPLFLTSGRTKVSNQVEGSIMTFIKPFLIFKRYPCIKYVSWTA